MEKHPLRIGLGDVVEYMVFERNPNKKVMRRGDVVAVVPEGFAPNRQWLNSKLQKTHYTYNFKLGVAYPHPTFIIKTAMGKKSFSYDRPRVNNIIGVVKSQSLQQTLFDQEKGIANVLANQIAEAEDKRIVKEIDEAVVSHSRPLPQSPSQVAMDLAKTLSGHVITFVRSNDIDNGFTLIDGTAVVAHVTMGKNNCGGSYTSIFFR